MSFSWISTETTTHQDHVIAHVVGATVLGYVIISEALHILLDIGFIWTVFVDGEMGLLPHPVAVSEFEITGERRREISKEIDQLLGGKTEPNVLQNLIEPPVECLITEVDFFAQGDRRRLILNGEEGSLSIETSLTTGEINVDEY